MLKMRIITTNRLRKVATVLSGALVALAVVITGQQLMGQEVDAATVYNKDIYYAVKTNHSSLITPWENEASGAVSKYTYTSYKKLFYASLKSSAGLTQVERFYNSRTASFRFAATESDKQEAISKGYKAGGTGFYASTVKTAETEAVYRYTKGNHDRYALTVADRTALEADGYKLDKVVFYARPAEAIGTPTNPVEPVEPTDPRDADGKFTFAVIPDSQMEVHSNRKGEFSNRMQWLVDNRNSLDLRFVAHTGDVVNWGWLEPAQFTVASDAAKILENAKIPYAFAIGTHDARAVGHDGVAGSRKYGGSAYVNNPECVERLGKAACQTGLLQHDTREFNAVFTAERFTHVRGAYQAGKVDNIYQTFEAAGKKWMLLTLEMAPRDAVIDWANGVIAAHSDHNVLIQTHYYLTASGAISTDSGYGDGSRSATNLYNRLVKVHPNIVAVFSGHVGKDTSSRTDTGNNGNKIVSYMAGLHDRETNPVRLVEIDVKKGSLESRIYAPSKDRTIEARSTETGLSFR